MNLSPIWRRNVKLLESIRCGTLPGLDKLHTVQSTELFCVNSTDRELQLASASWWLDHLRGMNARLADRLLAIGESREYKRDLCFTTFGLHLSLDFLKKANTALLASRYCGPNSSVLELGGGFGQLARLMILGKLCRHYTLVDLPETLYFAKLYLERECPGADITFIESDQFDHWTDGALMNDCWINTSSLGEMRGAIARNYINRLQKVSRSCVLLNRMLNTYHPIKEQFRENDLGWYWALDHYWHVDRVELEPDFTRIPPESMEHNRELLFMATRSAQTCTYSCFLPVNFNRGPSLRSNNQFLYDSALATRSLEYARTMRGSHSLDKLIRYLDCIALKMPFEDLAYLFRQYRLLSGSRHALEPSLLARIIRATVGPLAIRAYALMNR